MNKFLLVFTFIATSFSSLSQNTLNNSVPNKENDYEPLFLTYLSLSSAFENYNSLDFGMMQTFNKENAYGVELGYIYDVQGFNQLNTNNQYSEVYGAKLYFYYRFILENEINYPQNSFTFLDIESQFYWASFKSDRVAGYSCNDEFGDCEYYRFFDSRIERIIPGINFKIGKLYSFDPFYIKIFGGLGFNYIKDYTGLADIPDKMFTSDGQQMGDQNGLRYNFRLGVQVAYNIWN
ncbi:hypothetical protein QYS48_13040 [Marivirga arenosa]|uniref:DUF3575 domain-containing protein n=1 Tax=Marivirga arenosa TaxID=3059076 RepID=A0AA49GGT1_9BACT|nr:hypothetical protein [Marivirga sp. ABR2-2]WKK87545.2 hypothetical protein QYS48_13040 [Marivirga sp. ABR2-2]